MGAPLISGVSPTSGPPGTLITVTGTGLAQVTTVLVNGLLVSVQAGQTDTQLQFLAPTGMTGELDLKLRYPGELDDPTAFNETQPPPPSGMDLYAFSAPGSVTAAMVSALPTHVCGVSIAGMGWNVIQPTSETAFDWSPMDALIGAVSGKKKLYPRVEAGMHSPAWLPNQALVPGTYFQGGRSLTEPAPNDPTFLAAWTAFIKAFGARYDGNPSIGMIAMAGFGHQGESVFNEAAWPGWSEYGLTAATLQAATEAIFDAYRAAFPSHPTTYGIDPEPPFPGGGAPIAGAIAYAKSKYGNQIYLQQNGLRSTTTLTGKLTQELVAAAKYTKVGWQEYLGGGQSGPLDACLKLAFSVPSGHVEIYLNDVMNPANAATIAQYGNA